MEHDEPARHAGNGHREHRDHRDHRDHRENGEHSEEALELVGDAVDSIAALAPSVDVDAMRMVLLLHRVTNVVVYDLESSIHRPAGWSWAAFRCLFTLWVAGPLESSRLAARAGMSRQAVSALIKTLVADGLVRRKTAADDGRSVIVSLTPAGTRRLTAAYSGHNARERQWASVLDGGELATLLALLGKLAAAAREPWVSRRF